MCNYPVAYSECPQGPVRLKSTRPAMSFTDEYLERSGGDVQKAVGPGVMWARYDNGYREKPKYFAMCGACAVSHPVRFVKAAHPTAWHVAQAEKGRYLSECDARCLGGKKNCNCRCMGRCHGAGVCHCAKR